MCIWQSKNAVYGSMFYEWKKSLNVQEMHKTLHILGSLIVFPVVSTRYFNKELIWNVKSTDSFLSYLKEMNSQ